MKFLSTPLPQPIEINFFTRLLTQDADEVVSAGLSGAPSLNRITTSLFCLEEVLPLGILFRQLDMGVPFVGYILLMVRALWYACV